MGKSHEKNIRGIRIYKLCLSLLIILFCRSIYALEHPNLSKELERCLSDVWGVDQNTNAYIRNKLKPLLQDTRYHSTVQEFIALSKKQEIDFPIDKKIKQLPPDDGILKAPEEHLVVFENPYVRILWGSTAPGKREKFHEHAWKSVMLIIRPTTYEIEYPNGKKETIDYPIGVFELPAGERYACTNLGKSEDASLRFEIKD